MKLGTQTGSMTNHIYSRMTKGQPEPVVGMGATVLAWTDRHAATIIGVQSISYPIVWVREDHAERTDGNGMSECQSYTYTPNPNGRLYTFRFKDGRWQEITLNQKTGRWNKVEGGGYGLRIGEHEEYHDFSF